jgi:hypothetical protein
MGILPKTAKLCRAHNLLQLLHFHCLHRSLSLLTFARTAHMWPAALPRYPHVYPVLIM